METLGVKPVNKEVITNAKKKGKEDFLNSLSDRLNQVKLDMEGKIKLKSWDELYNEL